MEFCAELIDTLIELIADPEADIGVLVDDVLAAAGESIESMTSASITVTIEGYPFTATAAMSGFARSPRTSVSIPLYVDPGAATCSGLVLYAATPGSFIHFAADAIDFLRLDPAAVELDAHLSTVGTDAENADACTRTIDRAVGVLLARGASATDADTQLRQRAEREHLTLVDAACSVLVEVDPAICPVDDPSAS